MPAGDAVRAEVFVWTSDAFGIRWSEQEFPHLFVFCDQGFSFLKDVGLLRSEVQCITCGPDMTWSAEPSIPEAFRWRCRKKVAGVKCSESRSIKHGSWFQHSHLTLNEILLIKYDIVRREPARHIQKEYVVLALLRHLLLQVRARLCHLLQRHFRYVTPPSQHSHGNNAVSDVFCAGGRLESRIVNSNYITTH